MKKDKAKVLYANGMKHEVMCNSFSHASILAAAYAIEKGWSYKNMTITYNSAHPEVVFTIDIILL